MKVGLQHLLAKEELNKKCIKRQNYNQIKSNKNFITSFTIKRKLKMKFKMNYKERMVKIDNSKEILKI